jgi:glucose-1-phosphatase
MTEIAKKLHTKYLQNQNQYNPVVANFLWTQKQKGKKIYYLSALDKNGLNKVLQDNFGLFDDGLITAQSEFNKSNKEFYTEITEKHNLNPEKSVLIDDSEDNLQIAKKVDLKTVHFNPLETDLYDEINKIELKENPKILFLGKPNVGKSSLFNSMVGKEIQIVTDIAGTTMSVNDIEIERQINSSYDYFQLKNLVVDLGGVVVKMRVVSLSEYLLDEYGKEIDLQDFFKIAFTNWETFTKLSFWEKLITDLDLKKETTAKDLQDVFYSFNEPNYDILDFISAQKEAGWKVYYLSNGSQKDMENIEQSDFFELFDGGLFSWETDFKKPQTEFYNYFLEKFNLQAKNCLFIDDLEENLISARDLGFTVLHYPVLDILEKNDFWQSVEEVLYEDQRKISFKTKKKYVLLDSTGIRKPGQRTFGVETAATYKTIQAAYQADVICIVVDGSEPLSHQDQVVAGIAKEAKKGILVIVNKADLVSPENRANFIDEFQTKFQFLKVKNFVWVSAKLALETKQNPELIKNNQEKNYKYLILNFDGVIANTKELSLQADKQIYGLDSKQTEIFQEIYFQKPRNLMEDFYSELPFEIQKTIQKHTKGKTILEVRQERQKLFIDLLKKHPPEIFEGFLKELENLNKSKDLKLAIICKDTKDYIIDILKDKLITFGDELPSKKLHFDLILDNTDHQSTTAQIAQIAKFWQIEVEKCYYITANQTDVLELRAYLDEKKILAATWGFDKYETLKNLLPKKQVLKKFKEIHKVFPKELIVTTNIANLEEIWTAIDKSIEQRSQVISPEEIRKLFNFIVKRKAPQKLRSKKRPIIYDLLFTKNEPPTFELLVKDKTAVHWSYIRFLENLIRKNFVFENTEIVVKATEIDKKKVVDF